MLMPDSVVETSAVMGESVTVPSAARVPPAVPADIFTVAAAPSAEERFFTEALMSETVMAALGLTLVSRKLNLEFFTSAEATFHCQGLPAFSVVFASASFWAAFLAAPALEGMRLRPAEVMTALTTAVSSRMLSTLTDCFAVSRLPSLTEAVLAETSVDLPCFT